MSRLWLFSSEFDCLRNIMMSLDWDFIGFWMRVLVKKVVKPFPKWISWQGGFHCITFVDQERYVRASAFHGFLMFFAVQLHLQPPGWAPNILDETTFGVIIVTRERTTVTQGWHLYDWFDELVEIGLNSGESCNSCSMDTYCTRCVGENT